MSVKILVLFTIIIALCAGELLLPLPANTEKLAERFARDTTNGTDPEDMSEDLQMDSNGSEENALLSGSGSGAEENTTVSDVTTIDQEEDNTSTVGADGITAAGPTTYSNTVNGAITDMPETEAMSRTEGTNGGSPLTAVSLTILLLVALAYIL